MKNNLSCEIVEDLLPSYIDGLTSDVTNGAVREHIACCDECKERLINMKEPYNEEKIACEKKEIDFLKKTRKRNRRKFASGAVSVILAVLIAVCSLPYFVRNSLGEEMVLYSLDVKGDTFNFKATADHRNCVITDMTYHLGDSGILDVSFIGREKNFLEKRKLYTDSYTSDKVKTVTCHGKILWEDGEYIIPVVSSVFKYRTPYIGDISHNSLVAGALGISDNLGSFTNKLTTVKEPYGWELMFSLPFTAEQISEKETIMINYGYMLLGVIGNLSEVKFTYDVIDSEGEEVKHSLKVTSQEATAFFGTDIKKCSEDINILQSLAKKTGLSEMAYVESDVAESFEASINETVRLRLFNGSDADIKRIAVACRQTKQASATGFEASYSGSVRKPLITVSEHNFELELLSENAYDEKRSGNITLDIQIYDYDENVYSLKDPINVSAFSGAVYEYTLNGSFEKGFEVTQTP